MAVVGMSEVHKLFSAAALCNILYLLSSLTATNVFSHAFKHFSCNWHATQFRYWAGTRV